MTRKAIQQVVKAAGTDEVVDRSEAIKAKQDGDRRAARSAAVEASKVPPKKAVTGRAQKVAAPAAPVAKRGTTAKAGKAQAGSKAERVRALLDQGKTVNEIANELDDVTWSYAWDVAAAYEKKTGKVFIPSHAPKTTPRRAQAKRTAVENVLRASSSDTEASSGLQSAALEGAE